MKESLVSENELESFFARNEVAAMVLRSMQDYWENVVIRLYLTDTSMYLTFFRDQEVYEKSLSSSGEFVGSGSMVVLELQREVATLLLLGKREDLDEGLHEFVQGLSEKLEASAAHLRYGNLLLLGKNTAKNPLASP